MIQGLTSSEEEILIKLLIFPLKNLGARTWVFGSRARGDHKKFSDIDILYEFPNGSELPLQVLSDLKEQLEESSLPFKVDIVNLKDLAESYREGVMKERKLI